MKDDVRFRLLRLLQDNPEMSQRELADAVGISVGGMHYVLNALVEKGLIKLGNFTASRDKRRYAYLLTPQGLAEKAALTRSFLMRKRREYDALKAEIDALEEEVGDVSHLDSSLPDQAEAFPVLARVQTRNFMTKILITGTAGFIGFHLAKLLLDEGFVVHGYDGMTDYYDVALKQRRHAMLSENPNFSATEAMLEDQATLDAVADSFQPEVIVHLAAQAGVRYSLENPRAYLDSNVIGSFNVMEAARRLGVKHLLMASTSSVYGANEDMPFTETEKAETQLTIYAATKKATESMGHAYAHLWNLPTTMFRFFTVYGPWGRPDMALYKFADAILENRPIDIYNHGDMYRDFTYVEDLVRAIRLLIDAVPQRPASKDDIAPGDSLSPVAPFRVVNIGNSDKVRLLDFIEAIEDALGKKAIRNYLGMQKGDVPATWADASLLKRLTGYRPQTDYRDGVGRFVVWFQDYYRKKPKMTSSAQTRNLAIIGLGYVGLPIAVEFGKHRDVIGFDIKPERIAELRSGKDHTLEVSPEELAKAEHLTFTSDPADLAAASIYIVTVPTPIDAHKRPDLTPLIKASETVGKTLKKGDIVIYESTVYPGATEEDCVPVLERFSGLKFNEDFFCGYSPERINPGDKEHRLTTIRKVTSGSTPESAEIVDQLYASIITAGTYKAESIRVAEAAKVIENTQRDLNIALINELAIIFNRIGIDTQAVLEAAGTKWNFLPFRPGLVGGHCIGVDPYYLTHKAEEIGYHPEVILAGRRINDDMGAYVAEQLVKAMLKRRIQVDGARVLVLGLTFKEDCPDLRNTRVVDIVHELEDYGVEVDVHDPWASAEEAEAEYGIELVAELKAGTYDGIVLAVAHEAYNEMGSTGLRKFGRDTHVLFDVKGVFGADVSDLRL